MKYKTCIVFANFKGCCAFFENETVWRCHSECGVCSVIWTASFASQMLLSFCFPIGEYVAPIDSNPLMTLVVTSPPPLRRRSGRRTWREGLCGLMTAIRFMLLRVRLFSGTLIPQKAFCSQREALPQRGRCTCGGVRSPNERRATFKANRTSSGFAFLDCVLFPAHACMHI